jgi:hypothetical protein
MHITVRGVKGDQCVPTTYFDESGNVDEGKAVIREEAHCPAADLAGLWVGDYGVAEFGDAIFVKGGEVRVAV